MRTDKIYVEYLLLEAQKGNDDALGLLLQVLQQKMSHFAQRIMNGAADSEDCVQEAMLVVLKKYKQVKEVKAFHAWIYQVINSRCHDYWRTLHHNDCLDDLVSRSQEPCDPQNGVDDPLFDIKQAMTQLSNQQQAVLYLFYFEGFKVSEMAGILKKPAGTIKSILFDARQLIKTTLNLE